MTRWDLIRSGPYRLFFPLGVLNGILGVGHWVLWSVGWIKESDSFFHATLQVQGFLASFVVGFLMTALPRFLGASNARNSELFVSFVPGLCFTFFTLNKQWPAAQMSFVLMLGSVIPFAIRRFPQRSKNPPTSFLLIAFGLLHAFLATALFFISDFGKTSIELMELGRQMLQIGFVLCLVLGVAGYLAPFLMGYTADPTCNPGILPARGGGLAPVFFHGLTGILLLSTFLVEGGSPHLAAWARAVIVSIHFLWFARIGRWVKKKVVYVYFFWVSCWMIMAGLWLVALMPDWRIAGLHLIFIGGFSLMIFSFAMMVVLSHGARANLLNTPLIPLQVVGYSVLLAAALRLTADIDAWHYHLWIHLASGVWVIAAGVWLVYVLPKLWSLPPFFQGEKERRS